MENTYSIYLTSKVVLITGGYGHLGKGIVHSLLAHDATVYVLGRSLEKFNDVFGDQNKNKLFFQSCDVSDNLSVAEAIQAVWKKEGRIHSFINNAFYSKGQSPEEMADTDFGYCLDGTLVSAFRCIKSLLPIMKEQKYGKIINVSSMYGVLAPDFSIYDESPNFLNPPHYGAAKAGLIQLTKYYASYLGKYNINVNAVSPGPFPSETVQKDKGFVERLKNKTALKRIGEPSDLGGIFVFLSSDASNFITGQNFQVDGGWTIT